MERHCHAYYTGKRNKENETFRHETEKCKYGALRKRRKGAGQCLGFRRATGRIVGIIIIVEQALCIYRYRSLSRQQVWQELLRKNADSTTSLPDASKSYILDLQKKGSKRGGHMIKHHENVVWKVHEASAHTIAHYSCSWLGAWLVLPTVSRGLHFSFSLQRTGCYRQWTHRWILAHYIIFWLGLMCIHLLTERATFSSLRLGCLSSGTVLKTYWLVNVTASVRKTNLTNSPYTHQHTRLVWC